MKKYYHELIQEEYIEEVLDNGLSICIMKKAGFCQTCCQFTTKFGSAYQEFIPLGDKKYRIIPPGAAHFLEHQIFESDDSIDVSEKFAKLGCDVNAFTGYNMTSYVFQGTSNIKEAINLLLDSVQQPHFTETSMNRERDVICQELKMYMDKPQNALSEGLYKCLFKNNYINEDIGGTIESVKAITYDDLDCCYKTFYHPSNMALIIVGDVDVNEILNLVKENQNKKVFPPCHDPKTRFKIDCKEVNLKENTALWDIQVPKVAVGVKLLYENMPKQEEQRFSMSLSILLDMIFNYATASYQTLYDEGIISDNFAYTYAYNKFFSYIMIYDDIDKPDVFIKKIKEILLAIPNQELSQEAFNDYKRAYQAVTIKQYNSISSITDELSANFLNDDHLFDYFDILNELTINDLNAVKHYFIEDAIVSFMLLPK